MPITKEKRVVHNGVSGIARLTVNLLSRTDLSKMSQSARPGQEMTVGEILRKEAAIEFMNPYTGEIEVFNREALTDQFPDVRPDDGFLVIEVSFTPEPRQVHSRTLDELTDEMRRLGVPEHKIQEVTEIEKRRNRRG